MRNAKILSPLLARILINTYRDDSPLFIDHEVIYSQEGTTQGDPLAMHMYAIGTLPLIRKLPNCVQHIWFAEDASAGGQLDHLRTWWDSIQEMGPDFGYLCNAGKSSLIVKEEDFPRAESMFSGTGINITVEGKKHLGAPLGTDVFCESFISAKVEKWVEEIKQLSIITESQPHAAYSALTNGLVGRWTFLMRVVPDISEMLQPLEDAIRLHLLPAITVRTALSDAERRVLALPVRDSGLGIPIPTTSAANQLESSTFITQPLVNLLPLQHNADTVSLDSVSNLHATQLRLKKETSKHHREKQQEEAIALRQTLPASLQKPMELASEKGASAWLTTLPLEEHGFSLHKQAFRDALCVRYGWEPTRLPSHCMCGAQFTTTHAFSCAKGAFPSIRHDRIRDMTAQLLSEVCPNVEVEPPLQPLTGETFRHRTANVEDNARLDVKAQGFWGSNRQCAYFDVRVFNPHAPTNCNQTIAASYRRHENEKRREYEKRVVEVEHGSFTPIVMSSTGGWGPSAMIMYKRLASLIATKHAAPYSATMRMIRCKIAFSLIDSTVMCLRGARSSSHKPMKALDLIDTPVDLVVNEGRF